MYPLRSSHRSVRPIKFSIAMGTYNGARFLADQLHSLEAQTHLPSELQVGDDGSTDNTITILKDFAKRAPFPVHITQNEHNLGFGENFIRTANRCENDWIAFCDQDDLWQPHKLQCCADIIRDHAGILLVGHNAIVADSALEKGQIMDQSGRYGLFPRAQLPPGWISPGFRQIFRSDLIRNIPSTERNMMWWTGHENAHDAWTSLLASACGSVFITNDPLVLYRRHDANTTPLDVSEIARTEMILAALRNNFQTYFDEAVKTSQIAELLYDLSTKSTPQFSEPLAQSAIEISAYSKVIALRASIYQGKDMRSRTRALFSMLRAGGYSAGTQRRPGPRALLKDVCAVFLLSFTSTEAK